MLKRTFAEIVLILVILVFGLVVKEGTLNVSSETIAETQASLVRVPSDVHHREPVLILTDALGNLGSMKLSVLIKIKVTRDGTVVGGPWPRTRDLHFWPCSQGWYVTAIPGLPARSMTVGVINPRTWKIESQVSYSLIQDGVVRSQSSYNVSPSDSTFTKPPIVFATSRNSMDDQELLQETLGLGPKGWTMGAGQFFGARVTAIDDEGVDSVALEYSENNGTWKATPDPLAPDPLMGNLTDLVSWVNGRIAVIRTIQNNPFSGLGDIHQNLKVFNGSIPCSAGKNVRFHAKATDNNGLLSTSPEGFYYVVNRTSPTRVLIVDPYVKLGVLKSNLVWLKDLIGRRLIYKLPQDFGVFGDSSLLTRISDITKTYDLFPFHYWELLGKYYNLTIAWPGANLANLLRNQSEGGFEPQVIVLSNLGFGLNVTEDPGLWNWDLNDIKVNGQTVQEVLINYTKQHHSGLVATRGTLSDWVVWLSSDQSGRYKIGARGHVGDSIEDLDVANETTIASMLGMPQLALWEYIRDTVAQILASDPPTSLVGMAVGSLPLQVPFVPLNSSLHNTVIGAGHPILEGVESPFDLPVPSIVSEFGFATYTQVGWQLAMARQIAYDAWTKSNKTLPLAEETTDRFSRLIENVTKGSISRSYSSRIDDSLGWAVERLYSSIISASISRNTLNATFDFHELTSISLPQLENMPLPINFAGLLQLLPVKLIACSENYTAGITAYDKYWDEEGYRSVYFSVEPEACNNTVSETLLKNAVNWTLQWNYTDVTTLLGEVRVQKDLADAFQSTVKSLPGESAYSDSLILVEEGQTIVDVNATTSGPLYLLVAHPTCEKVNVTLVDGNGELQNVTRVVEGLTQATIQAHEPGIIKISISADPESSLNPAYVVIVPEFPSLAPILLALCLTSFTVVLVRRAKRKAI